jgi:hypothetical protein
MLIFFKALIAIVIVSLLSACGTTAEITDAWIEPELNNKNLNGVLVVAISKSEKTRISFEQAYTDALKKKGVNAMASYALVDGKAKKEDLLLAAKEADLETILVARYAGTVEEPVLYKGTNYYARSPVYGGGYHDRFGGYYGHLTKVYSTPDVWTTNSFVIVVSDLYETATEEHLWQASSRAMNPDNMTDLRDAFIRSFVKNMDEQKMLDK